MNPEGLNPAELLREEIARIKGKREKIQDVDMRDAMDMKIAHLEERLTALTRPKEEVEIPEEPLEPPTPKQLQEADALIRQARVEKMRNNAAAATDLLRQAVAAAPTAPAVLEALADDLMERRQKKEALPIYKKAVKLDPRNVGLERKYAMLVLGGSGPTNFEEAMRSDWTESTLISENDHVASPAAATLLTIFIPGAGHLVLGKTSTGIMLIAAWAACCLWLALMAKDFAAFAAKLSGKDGGHVNYIVIVPLVIIAIIYIGAINSLRVPKKIGARIKVDRPRPPVNLPFE